MWARPLALTDTPTAITYQRLAVAVFRQALINLRDRSADIRCDAAVLIHVRSRLRRMVTVAGLDVPHSRAAWHTPRRLPGSMNLVDQIEIPAPPPRRETGPSSARPESDRRL